jgi:hypothetical protein
MRSLVLLALVGAALLVSACGGGGGGGSDEEEIRSTIEALSLSNDPADCARYATRRLLMQSSKRSAGGVADLCAELSALESPLPRRVTVTESEVDGDRATAHVAFEGSSNDGQTVEFALVRSEDQWKIDEMLSFVVFDRGRMIFEAGRALMESAESASQVQLSSCMLGQLEKLGNAQLEEITLSFTAQPMIDLFRPCVPRSAAV